MGKFRIEGYIKIPIAIEFQAASELAAREVWDNNTTLRRAVLKGKGWDNDPEHWAVIRETLYQTDIESVGFIGGWIFNNWITEEETPNAPSDR